MLFPANSCNQSKACLNSAEFLSNSHAIFGNSLPPLTTSSNQLITFSDMWATESKEAQTDDSFERVLNQVVPIAVELFARTSSMSRVGAIRRKKPTQRKPTQKKERKSQLKFKYAQILANLRSKKENVASIQTKKTQVNRLNASKPGKLLADDKNSIPNLTGILDAENLLDLVDDDPTYRDAQQKTSATQQKLGKVFENGSIHEVFLECSSNRRRLHHY